MADRSCHGGAISSGTLVGTSTPCRIQSSPPIYLLEIMSVLDINLSNSVVAKKRRVNPALRTRPGV